MMQQTTEQLLADALAQHAQIILSLPREGMLSHHRSRLLGMDQAGLWIEAIADDQLIGQLIRLQEPVGLSFRASGATVALTANILRRNQSYFSRGISAAALQLKIITQPELIRRRRNYRIRAFPGCDLRLRLWRIAEQEPLMRRPACSDELPCDVRDISHGGIGVVVRQGDQATIPLQADQRLRVEVTYHEHSALIEGRVRHVESQPHGAVRIGVEFMTLLSDHRGRQHLAALHRIVGLMQRDEARRMKLGLPLEPMASR